MGTDECRSRINDYCADNFHTEKLCNQNNRFMHYEYFTLECVRQNGYRVSDSMPQCEVLREMGPFFAFFSSLLLLLSDSRICIFRCSFALLR